LTRAADGVGVGGASRARLDIVVSELEEEEKLVSWLPEMTDDRKATYTEDFDAGADVKKLADGDFSLDTNESVAGALYETEGSQ
jgi:hypothetical protein